MDESVPSGEATLKLYRAKKKKKKKEKSSSFRTEKKAEDEEERGDDCSFPGISRERPLWLARAFAIWDGFFLGGLVYFFAYHTYRLYLYFVYDYDKNKIIHGKRRAPPKRENGKYPLKVQASARCFWPLTNVVESSVEDWQVRENAGGREWEKGLNDKGTSECERRNLKCEALTVGGGAFCVWR